MTDTLRVLSQTIAKDWKRLLVWGLVTAVLFQVFMMIALIVRFQAVPNYVTFYNWIGNVAWIVQSTPSWGDIPAIVAEEWLIEIGFMNYDYGNGISEWSLNVVPSRMLVLFGLGFMLGLCTSLLRSETCRTETGRSVQFGAGAGAFLVAMTNATMSWVVCCATPSWVVGLAMLGLGVSTSLALETMGPILSISGFSILAFLIIFLAWRRTRPSKLELEPAHA